MRLLVTRPAPDAQALAEKLAALGHEPVVSPLSTVEFLDPGPLPLAGAQALIATSGNALRALQGAGQLEHARTLPLFAAGAASARMARAAGFAGVHEGGGTAQSLAPVIAAACRPNAGPLVHLAGEGLAWDLKGALEREGFAVVQPVLYRARPAERFGAAAVDALNEGTLHGVILMSPAAARTYAGLIHAQGLEQAAAKLTLYCLSPNVAAGLGALQAGRIAVAARPSQDDLLALIGPEAANC
jgi:uroporphyrinogen-III synthase